MFDVVLADGWIVDGTGAPPTRADLGITGATIGAVGQLSSAATHARLDCSGLYLLPGFIDTHVHAEAAIFDPDVHEAMLAQGVTSIVVGQDGLSFAPATPTTTRYVADYFAAVNGPWVAVRPAPGTIADWLSAYDATVPINVGVLVPHGNLRHMVAGTDARALDRASLDRMRGLLDDSLSMGALGLSSGLDYLPGLFADAAELAFLCERAAAVGAPYVTHMRGYEAKAANGMAEVRAIAQASGVAAHVSHYHGPAHMLAELVDDARHAGLDITFDSYPYTSGASILAMVALPSALQADGPAATIAHLLDTHTRESLLHSWFSGSDHAAELARVRLSHVASPEHRWAEGMLLPDAATKADLGVGEFVCDVLAASRLDVGCVFRQPPTNTDADVRALLRHDAHMAGSDGIYVGSAPHPRGWGTFSRLLGRHTRELGDWSWAQAAVHLAGHPARRFNLTHRGLLRAGMAADVVVLDPNTVADVGTYDDPRRPARGVRHVYVNGALVFDGGRPTGALAGRGLRRANV